MAGSDPGEIAIIGMACRLPGGVRGPEELWSILVAGRDVVTEVSEDRWNAERFLHPDPDRPGSTYTRAAGVLAGIDEFDAEHFGISPREAAQVDPQQRLLLEMAWEALEDAGLPPERVAGSSCAVFVGISSTDYADIRFGDPCTVDAHFMTGSAMSLAANRISYTFDLRGPSMSVDTACSSSLVAVHQACQSIRHGEASLALAGGVNLLISPYPFIGFSKARMLSPTGRCRAFAADADGYVRAEGGAVLVLKPLAQALEDGDRVHAVIVASGVGSDGGSPALTVPSAEAQEALLRSTYRQAGVDPADLVYLEAHGTGTAAGDLPEATAIGRALGFSRRRPLPIGSVKTNLGHLEAAAGMAGLVKVVLALGHRCLPPSLHCSRPNPRIPFAQLGLEVVTELVRLPEGAGPAVMGVNSFGFGGTNAHVVLREHSEPTPSSGERPATCAPLLVLSARRGEALAELAGSFGELLRSPQRPPLGDITFTAAARRSHLEHRLAVVGRDEGELAERLGAFAAGHSPSGVVSGRVLARPARLALVFSGNGSQWYGMGRQLAAEAPLFREAVEEVDALLTGCGGSSVMGELVADTASSRLALTEVAQPALFALQVGLVRLLRARGLRPEAVVGHSVGEVAAAWAAGALSLEQAVAVIHHRSTAQAETRGHGRMAAVGISAEEAVQRLEGLGAPIELAAINSPCSVTLAGPLSALEELARTLEGRGVPFRMLDLDHAFHSAAMDPIEDRLISSLHGLAPCDAELRFVSTVTGGDLPGQALGAVYWWDNVRRPVDLCGAVDTLAGDGFQVFLEIGPHPILQGYIQQTLAAGNRPGQPVVTLAREAAGSTHVMEALGMTHVLGCSLDYERVSPEGRRCVSLPRCPLERTRHWFEGTSESVVPLTGQPEHPLLGHRRPLDLLWENQLDVQTPDFLADHEVEGAPVLPAAAAVEMALAASALRHGGSRHLVEGIELRRPLVLERDRSKVVRFELSPADGSFTISSRTRLSQEAWSVNVVGRLAEPAWRREPVARSIPERTRRLPDRVDAAEHYRRAEALGLSYGPAFRGVGEVWVGPGNAIARITGPADVALDLAAYHLHPCLLDACFQVLFDVPAAIAASGPRWAYVPHRIERVRFFGAGTEVAYSAVVLERVSPRSMVARFELLSETGRVVAELEGCRFQRLASTSPPALYELRPVSQPRVDPDARSPLPGPAALAAHADRALDRQWQEPGRREHYERVLPLFDALVSSFAYEALRPFADPEGLLGVSAMVADGGIDARLAPLVVRLLGVLEEDGLAARDGDRWRLTEAAQAPPAEAIWRAIVADHPRYLAEAVLAGRVGRHLTEVLRGELAAEEILDPDSGSAGEGLLASSPTFGPVSLAARSVLAAVVREWPPSRRLRVLAVGAGSGGLTADLVPVLAGDHCDLVVSGWDDDAVARAAARWADVPFVSVERLEASRDVDEQGFVRGSFDLVVVAHALHEIDDVQQALRRLRTLLASGGALLLVESRPERLTDLVLGIRERWWARTTEVSRPVSRLRPPDEWIEALTAAGFVEPVAICEGSPDDDDATAYLILACGGAAGDPSPSESREGVAGRASEGAVVDREDTGSPGPRSFLLLADAEGDSRLVAESLHASLKAGGHRPVVVVSGAGLDCLGPDLYSVDWSRADDARRLALRLREEGAEIDDLVLLTGLTFACEPPSSELLELQERRCVTALHVLQSLHSARWRPWPRLWLVTAGAIPLTRGSPTAPSQAPLWGIGRVLANEHPELEPRLVDLHAGSDCGLAGRLLAAELLEPGDENEVVLGSASRSVMRCRRTRLDGPAQGSESGVRLVVEAPGPLDELRWTGFNRRPPGPEEIEVRVRAAGLSFRDVMWAMGVLPDEAVEAGFAGPSLGMECAGEVVAVGDSVADLRVGDGVLCFAPSCFASHVTTPAAAAVAKPDGLSFEEAATIPVVFLTAYYALHDLARLEGGERVLVHGGAGGLGLAAIQYARHRGAEVFATAGSTEKRDFLRLLGVDHVLDSRSLSFADEILEITGGQGVDVVLNSLAGEAITRSLAVLRPFGRFLEVGKRDIYANTRIGLRPFRNNIAYFAIDADQLLCHRPALATRLLREVMQLVEARAFRPLVHRVFGPDQAVDAFRLMQQSRHIGKIVLQISDDIGSVHRGREVSGLALRPDASYLVTGGLGGLGLATARWMVDCGARSLVLAGRSGASTPEARSETTAIENADVRVHVARVDVTDEGQLRALLEHIADNLPPLRGVVHAAMVLDDGAAVNLDRDRLMRVLAPKVLGAWNLHRLTLDLPLDLFVMYSSATTLLGNPGQANYVAANLYLESLADHRRQLGLPALTVSWGPISDVGVVARDPALRSSLQALFGGHGLSSSRALAVLGRLLSTDRTCVVVADIDWRRLLRALPDARSARISGLVHRAADADADMDHGATAEELITLGEPERVELVVKGVLVEEIGRVLRLPVDRVDADGSIRDMGMDSLLAVELGMAVERRLGVVLPPMVLAQGGSVAGIARRLAEQLGTGAERSGERASSPTAPPTMPLDRGHE